jgi:SAM-dependent methyltransferase
MSQRGRPRPVFLIARNPQPDTKLPYLLKLPLGGSGAEAPRSNRRDAAMPTIHNARASMLGLFGHAHRYDQLASRFLHGLYARVAADVAAAGLHDGARVLDVGTGPGRVPLAIAQALPGLRVEGLDLSAEMIASARRNATDAGLDDKVRFTVGDVADLPHPDDTFDLIVSTMSQHHWPDAVAGLRELRRVVRPGGQIWIYDLRFALGRAEAAARGAFPAPGLHRELLRTGRLPLRLIGRLTIDPVQVRR